MIKLSNEHRFNDRAASGALAYDGLGWLWEQPLRWLNLLDVTLFTAVIKSLTLLPRRGNLRWYNPHGCIRVWSEGAHNAVGLTNPGVEWWCDKVGPKIDSRKRPVMGSIFGEPDELKAMAEMMDPFDLVGQEVNASCPNSGDDTLVNTEKVVLGVKKVYGVTRHPIILKLSTVHDIGEIVPAVRGMVEAFAINSVIWKLVYPDKRSPLAHLGGGGVSGKVVQPFTWPFAQKLTELSDIPVCWPSVWDYEDVVELRRRGAAAIDFGSIFLRYPWRPTDYVTREAAEQADGLPGLQLGRTA